MPIRFECDSCGKRYRVKNEAKGRRFECHSLEKGGMTHCFVFSELDELSGGREG